MGGEDEGVATAVAAQEVPYLPSGKRVNARGGVMEREGVMEGEGRG